MPGDDVSEDPDVLYPCVGICTPDPETGRCLGCGAPLIDLDELVAPSGSDDGTQLPTETKASRPEMRPES